MGLKFNIESTILVAGTSGLVILFALIFAARFFIFNSVQLPNAVCPNVLIAHCVEYS